MGEQASPCFERSPVLRKPCQHREISLPGVIELYCRGPANPLIRHTYQVAASNLGVPWQPKNRTWALQDLHSPPRFSPGSNLEVATNKESVGRARQLPAFALKDYLFYA